MSIHIKTDIEKKSVILINGSPRKKGTSYSFARRIKQIVEGKGSRAEIVHIIDYFEQRSSIAEFRKSLNNADIIAIISPLYVDTLPYPVIWFLEKLQAECCNELCGKDIFAIGQSGFPDSTLMEPLIESCRLFASELKMKWLGGIGYGGGAIINGTHMEDLGRKGRKITFAFDLLADDVLSAKPISVEAKRRLTVKIPKILLRPLAGLLNLLSRRQAKANGVKDLGYKAYLE